MKTFTKKTAALLTALLALLMVPSACFQAEAEDGFLTVTGPCNFSFPRDHGPHPGYRTEWWYYTGNLSDEAQRPYGFQLTFFRRQISPSSRKSSWPVPASSWRTQQLYVGHAAVSDISGKVHRQAEDMARNALGLAGVDQTPQQTVIHLKNWSAAIAANQHVIQADSADFGYQLRLTLAKPPVLHGDAGYSRKGFRPENASCYYSFTRLEAAGSLRLSGRSIPVKGLGWMDHEFSSVPLASDIKGWDWFGLQLSDRTELMIFLLRKARGVLHGASGGTYITEDGRVQGLSAADFKIEVLENWSSKSSKAVYPSKWRLSILPLSISLDISSNLADQEMRTLASTGVSYWEGSVSCRGKRNSSSLTGSGYVELTGYAGALDAGL